MPRALLIYVLILPLAVLLGYMLATPTDFNSFAVMLLAFGGLSIPLFLKGHHFLLACTWNAALIVFFLPGQPELGTVLAFVCLLIALINRAMSRQKQFLRVPSITLPLILLTVVIVITAKLTGGIGARALGAETWGAKRYLGVFGAIVAYFAFVTQRIPVEKAKLYTAVFFLGGMTSLISDLAYMGGPSFNFLFILFPSEYAGMQALTADTLLRLSGLAFACSWGYYFLLSRYGIQELFDLRRPWRLMLALAAVAGSLLGGYRGLVILLMLVSASQFLVEGVYKTKLGPILFLVGSLAVVGTIGFVDRMPLAVQRAFSFLPLDKIDPAARQDALGTLDWRLSMWKILIPEIPKYFFLGKGYSYSGTDYYLTMEAVRKGYYQAYEDVLVSGNYHNGILTLLIPFGIFGFGAFIWFCFAALRVLVNNRRYGDPRLRIINTFLLADFVGCLIFYFVFYGQFDLDLVRFTGLVALSISLNGGLLTRPQEAEVPEAELVPVFQSPARAVAF